MSVAVETVGLTKRYGDLVAVQGLNLRLNTGEVFGMLGPNGSGKTTTILMLLGLTEPTAGTARVLGWDPTRQPLQVKRRVGYLPDSVGFYDELTAWENLRYTAALNGLPSAEANRRIGEVLERMGLQDVAHRKVGTFSRGMKQRLGLADVLLKQPQVAILDEPTLGLDPEAALEFLALIRSLKRDGLTVLLASHLLHQVQSVCDRVGLFHRGRMVLEGTVDELREQVLGGAYRIHVQARGVEVERALREVPGVVRVTRTDGDTYRVEARVDCRAEIARRVVASGELLALSVDRPGLDEVYARYFQQVEADSGGAA
ncbi:MAG: ABC transporter ATP-binding protein [Armatimonadota bacterium]|nr:ABC transporter ATP-binding protein [Armatimonadota bacterium]MDR5675376.1 ABC transporter ATP-binding protein [Armatimonadota bacterium]MDR5688657.1 ABC transporter ATP-binding protein [Armatimonadota bacterium]MDR7385849.1 ABC transporter ATP-binding protein [Armatimonadota bacterium]MDR7388428.1 ABC transporter ATP-binding protein [Armatimonadota bacterium]